MILASWGEYDNPACGSPASFSVHLDSSEITLAVSVHKSRGDHVCECYRGGICGDGCDLASTSCKK